MRSEEVLRLYPKFGTIFEKIIDPTKYKRIFVAGDLHGAYDKLMHALKNVNFSETDDLLILCGDLIDRGPKSLECLSLITEPWVEYVVGNHEQTFVSHMACSGDAFDRSFEMNGGDWVKFIRSSFDILALDDCYDYAQLLCHAPRMITLSNLCHVVHAELYIPPFFNVELTEQNYQTFLKMLMTIQTLDGDCSFWGRRVFDPLYGRYHAELTSIEKDGILKRSSDFDQMNPIISGHTQTKEAVQFGQMILIDSGAWKFEQPLTLYEVKEDIIHETWTDSSMLYNVRKLARY